MSDTVEFRFIDEGQGATLPINKTHGIKRTGTGSLMTCVGVYFQVDNERCFFAHIDARSPETFTDDGQAVTPAVHFEMTSAAKTRLLSFLKADRWDMKDDAFGKNLTVQCPMYDDMTYGGQGKYKEFQTPGKLVIRGTMEFFRACGQLVKEEVEQRQRVRPNGSQERIDFDQDTAKLSRRSDKLHEISQSPQVDVKHHILIVEPASGEIMQVGSVKHDQYIWRNVATNLTADLGSYIAVPVEDLPPHRCQLGVLKDDQTAFPTWAHATKERVKSIVEKTMWARKEYDNLGSDMDGDPTLDRFAEILADTHVIASLATV